MITPGSKVLIVEDCRNSGNDVTGQAGIFEGYFPVEVLDDYEQIETFNNPRIRLNDNSVIWGFECWWEPLGKSLQQAQEDLRKYQAEMHAAFGLGED